MSTFSFVQRLIQILILLWQLMDKQSMYYMLVCWIYFIIFFHHIFSLFFSSYFFLTCRSLSAIWFVSEGFSSSSPSSALVLNLGPKILKKRRAKIFPKLPHDLTPGSFLDQVRLWEHDVVIPKNYHLFINQGLTLASVVKVSQCLSVRHKLFYSIRGILN